MKKFLWVFVFSGLLALGWQRALFSADNELPQTAPVKLDQILRNQEEILKKLGEIKSELQVVKVRATNG